MKVTWKISEGTSTRPRVFVGLSGGVDSAAAAALLVREGYDVTGVFIRIALEGYPCTAGEDKRDAMRVAAHLKIPFLSVDLSKEYAERVFSHSLREFAQGRTPNPDALCNREIKFGLFYEWCRAQGADFVATGHYAKRCGEGLCAAADKEKDQSYFLWAVPKERLERTLFPLGDMHKSDVREFAEEVGLPNAARPDSQGLCFLGPVSIEDMLARELTLVPGSVRTAEGEEIGTHQGAARYTLGQRHGFTVVKKTPEDAPYFVIGKDIEHNTITVSHARLPEQASRTVITLREENWFTGRPKGACAARYRYRQALIEAHAEEGTVVLLEPQYVPEGQSLVLYDGERCLGGGVVDKCALE